MTIKEHVIFAGKFHGESKDNLIHKNANNGPEIAIGITRPSNSD